MAKQLIDCIFFQLHFIWEFNENCLNAIPWHSLNINGKKDS